MRLPAVLVGALLLLFGCSAQRPDVPQAIQASHQLRPGQVYLVRGLLGVFSTGMDQLCDQLREQGVPAAAIMHTAGDSAVREIVENKDQDTPIIIIGHSLGADEAVSMARKLAEHQVTVDLMITLDPVDAPRVPTNVRRAVNYYRSNGALDLLPVFRGTPLHKDQSTCILTNIDLNQNARFLEPNTNHFTIDKNTRVQQDILKQVLEICRQSRQSGAVMAAARLSPSSSAKSTAESAAIRKAYH